MNQLSTRTLQLANQFGFSPLFIVIGGMWLLTMIAIPIAYSIYGEQSLTTLVTAGVFVQASVILSILQSSWGWTHTLRILLVIAILTWVAEFAGSQTGFPFGEYHYTPRLQPQLNGVPLLIPLAWFMMLPCAWAVAQIIVSRWGKSNSRLQFAVVATIAMTAWDLFLDPQMVAWGFWQWEYPSGYFGIPWSNYLGWLFVAFVLTFIIFPKKLPVLQLLLVYGFVWFFQTVGQSVFWGQPGPALVGGIVMGSILIASVIALRQQS